jgi:predicted Fe-S protein YdhL (DUF1289 family)
VDAFAKRLNIESALRWARLVPSDHDRREIMRDVAVMFARADNMTDALISLEEENLDGFIQGLGMLCASWSSATRDQILGCLRAVTAVAGWVRSDWTEIHTVLLA